MDKQNGTHVDRKSKLAARFSHVEDFEQPLRETCKNNKSVLEKAVKQKSYPKTTLPAGSEGEQVIGGTKFFFNENDPRLNGTSQYIKF